jgi:hypothetical protein
MTGHPWIVCERSSRWVSALRMTLAEPARQPAHSTAIIEVRGLTELTDCFKEHPTGFVLVEVMPINFEAVLTWLAAAANRDSRVAVVGLLEFPASQSDLPATVLREAGAIDVIHSPRQIRPVLALGERHVSRRRTVTSIHCQANQSFENWARSLLPWQDAGRPLG